MSDKLLEELEKQTKWLRFIAMANLKKVIEENVQTKEQRKIYSLSDGKNTTYGIAEKLLKENLKVSHMTVYNYWRRWNALGIVTPSERYHGRYKKIINLEDLGIKS